jgi:hypothetical protein
MGGSSRVSGRGPGAHGGVGHAAVQVARSLGTTMVEEGEACDLLFDTAGGEVLAPPPTRQTGS